MTHTDYTTALNELDRMFDAAYAHSEHDALAHIAQVRADLLDAFEYQTGHDYYA